MQKILAKFITATAQVYTGKCYFLGAKGKYDTHVHDVELSTNAANANQVAKYEADTGGYMLPEPGIECSNGLYVVSDGWATVYYSI